jgi:hypothetical protein
MPMLPPRLRGSCALSVQVIRGTMDKLQILRLFRSSDRDLAQPLRDFLVEAPIPMLLNNLRGFTGGELAPKLRKNPNLVELVWAMIQNPLEFRALT